MPQSRERKKVYHRELMRRLRAEAALAKEERHSQGVTEGVIYPSVTPHYGFFPRTPSMQHPDALRLDVRELRDQVAALRTTLNQVIAVLSLPKRLQEAAEEGRQMQEGEFGIYTQRFPHRTLREEP